MHVSNLVCRFCGSIDAHFTLKLSSSFLFFFFAFQSVFAMDHRVLMAARAACQPVGLLTARACPDTVVQHVLVSQY